MAHHPGGLPNDLLHSLLIHENDRLVSAETSSQRDRSQDVNVEASETTENSVPMSTSFQALPFRSYTTAQLSNNTLDAMDIDTDVQQLDRQENASTSAGAHSGKLYTLAEWDNLYAIPKPSVSQAPTTPLPAVRLTGETVAKANHLCQIHAMVPIWTFEDVSKGCFTSKVEFGSHVCEAKGPFPSKKQAKEVVAQKALSILETLKAPDKRKRKRELLDRSSTSDREGTHQSGLTDENWVGRLTEFTQSRKSSPAHFQSVEASTHAQQLAGLTLSCKSFACVVRLDVFPDHIFGSDSTFYNTKVEAKRAAARDAILWLRANGHLPRLQNTRPPKRSVSSTADERTGLTLEISQLNAYQSSARLVAERSVQLGFSQPRFEIWPCEPPAGTPVSQHFYTASAHYSAQDVQREPRLQGTLFETSAVFGQKGAKDMCCRGLLGLLESILRDREDRRKMHELLQQHDSSDSGGVQI